MITRTKINTRGRPPALRRLSALLLTLGFVWSLGSRATAELAPEDLYAQIEPSVMTLAVHTTTGESFVGNAFLAYAPDLALTAWHVVYDARRVEARFADQETVPVVGWVDRDPARDLALIKLARPVSNRKVLQTASVLPRTGARIYVIGAPKGFDFSICFGLLSQQRSIDGVWHYQLACPISSGNSGGPVLDSSGEVIGLVSWRQPEAESLGFAIPSSTFSSLTTTNSVVKWSAEILAKSDLPLPQNRASTPAPTNPGNAEDLQKFLSSRTGRKINIVCTEEGDSIQHRFELSDDPGSSPKE